MARRHYFFAAGLAGAFAIPQPVQADISGLYFGSHIGGNFSSFNVEGDFDNGSATAYELDPSGWTAGVHLGYNVLYEGLLVGFEAAYSAGNEVDTHPVGIGGGAAADDFASYVFNDTVTLAARIAVPLGQRHLPFVKAGIAWADIEGQSGDTDGAPPFLDFFDTVRFNGWQTGFVLGAGWEVLWAPKWSLRAEYEYMDFGTVTAFNRSGEETRLKIHNQALKLGVSRHF